MDTLQFSELVDMRPDLMGCRLEWQPYARTFPPKEIYDGFIKKIAVKESSNARRMTFEISDVRVCKPARHEGWRPTTPPPYIIMLLDGCPIQRNGEKIVITLSLPFVDVFNVITIFTEQRKED